MAEKQLVQNQDLIHQNPPCPKCGFSGVGNSDSQKRRRPFSIKSEQPDAKKLFLASGTGSGNSSNAAPKTAPNPDLVMPCSATGLSPRPPPRRRPNLYPISSPSHSPLESARTLGSLSGVSSNASPKTTPKRDSAMPCSATGLPPRPPPRRLQNLAPISSPSHSPLKSARTSGSGSGVSSNASPKTAPKRDSAMPCSATGLPPRPPPRRLQNLAPISSPSHSPLESARTSGSVSGVSSNASPKSAPKRDSAMPCSAIGRPPRPPPYRRLKSTPILSAEKSFSRTSANSDNSKNLQKLWNYWKILKTAIEEILKIVKGTPKALDDDETEFLDKLELAAVAVQSMIVHELKETPPVPVVRVQKAAGKNARPIGMIIKVKRQTKKARLDQGGVEDSSKTKKTVDINTEETSHTGRSSDVIKTGLVSYSGRSDEDD